MESILYKLLTVSTKPVDLLSLIYCSIPVLFFCLEFFRWEKRKIIIAILAFLSTYVYALKLAFGI